MEGSVLLSTAYFPPGEYFSLMVNADEIYIETWENYHKQTFRNRCTILGANGRLDLIVPVLRGSFHKTSIRDLLIDNDRKWRELHLRSITSAYSSAPYFEYFFDPIKDVISCQHKFLLDLNMSALHAINNSLGLDKVIKMTEEFTPEGENANDFRYYISPKNQRSVNGYSARPYTQVFSDRYGFVEGLSIIDLLFNNGPGTKALLQKSLA